MLIDSTHKTWFWTTLGLAAVAVGLYVWLDHRTPGGLTGGSLVGLWYGLVGAGLMAFAGALSLLRRVPSWWWIGSRQAWLRGHIWLGLLSGVLIGCHSHGRFGGPLEQILMAVVILTLVTGVAGLLLQNFLPRLLAARFPDEAPYEQIPRLCDVLRQKADRLVEAAKADARIDEGGKADLATFYRERVRPFLAPAYDRSSPLARPLQAEAAFDRVRLVPGMAALKAQLDELESLCGERRQLGEQERIHRWLHAWLLAHVPLSLALLVLGLAHAVMSLYY